jgi:hypothetical protein
MATKVHDMTITGKSADGTVTLEARGNLTVTEPDTAPPPTGTVTPPMAEPKPKPTPHKG